MLDETGPKRIDDGVRAALEKQSSKTAQGTDQVKELMTDLAGEYLPENKVDPDRLDSYLKSPPGVKMVSLLTNLLVSGSAEAIHLVSSIFFGWTGRHRSTQGRRPNIFIKKPPGQRE